MDPPEDDSFDVPVQRVTRQRRASHPPASDLLTVRVSHAWFEPRKIGQSYELRHSHQFVLMQMGRYYFVGCICQLAFAGFCIKDFCNF